ncbi:MAG: hypothetical protein AB1734_08505 [Elusimicrobiota bacterium]
MNAGEEKEKKLLSLLAVERPEAFWSAQRERIISAAGGGAAARRRPARLWLPAAAAAAVMIVALALPWRSDRPPAALRTPSPAVEPPVSPAFLEHLDLLADMDVLESLSEEEL